MPSAHVKYLKSMLDVEYVDISSIVDLGFGYGYLFKEMLKAFIPHTAEGIEPSEYAFKKASKLKLSPADSTVLKLKQMDIVTWCREKNINVPFDSPSVRVYFNISLIKNSKKFFLFFQNE